MIKIIQIFLFSLIALQPLHSYTVINTSSMPQDNGFHLLHAELCGSKYTNSISHTKKLSNLLDKINTLLFCLICLKIVSVVIQLILIQQILLPSNINISSFQLTTTTIRASYYDLNVKSLLTNSQMNQEHLH